MATEIGPAVVGRVRSLDEYTTLPGSPPAPLALYTNTRNVLLTVLALKVGVMLVTVPEPLRLYFTKSCDSATPEPKPPVKVVTAGSV